MNNLNWDLNPVSPEILIEKWADVLKTLDKVDLTQLDPKDLDTIYDKAFAIINRCMNVIEERDKNLIERERKARELP